MKHLFTSLIKTGDILAVAGFWFSVWLYRALLFTFAGGMLGFLIAPITKVLFFKNSSWLAVFKGGFLTGCQYAGLWATAVAMVWVIMDRCRIADHACRKLGLNQRRSDSDASVESERNK